MSTHATTGEGDHGHHDAHADHADHSAHAEIVAPAVDNDELEGIKMLALESAELATRSANLAVGAGENMKKATHNLEELMAKNKKQTQILLGSACGLMFVVALVFATVVFSLKSRIVQMDAMLESMSKHIVELNDSMELVGSVNEGLQEMVSKQDEISKAQGSLEARLNEAIKNAESVPEKTAQQVGEKGQILATQMKSLEGRFAQQSRALEALSGKVNGLQGAVGETGTFKKEMEALARLQKERQAAENAAAAAAAAKAAAAAANANNISSAQARQREKMVQYPRVQQESSPAGASGVLNSKP
jgi:DNA repair exonuclease SbcCD ATPase subunit